MGSESEGTQDYGLIREAISGSTKILETVIKLADNNHLKYIYVSADLHSSCFAAINLTTVREIGIVDLNSHFLLSDNLLVVSDSGIRYSQRRAR